MNYRILFLQLYIRIFHNMMITQQSPPVSNDVGKSPEENSKYKGRLAKHNAKDLEFFLPHAAMIAIIKPTITE